MKYHKLFYIRFTIVVFLFLLTVYCTCTSYTTGASPNINEVPKSHHDLVQTLSDAPKHGVVSDLSVADPKILRGEAHKCCSGTSPLYSLIQYILVLLRSPEGGRKLPEVPAQQLIGVDNLENVEFQRSTFEKKCNTWMSYFTLTFLIVLIQSILIASALRGSVSIMKADYNANVEMESHQSIRSFPSLLHLFESKKIWTQRSEHFSKDETKFGAWMNAPKKAVGFFEYFVYPLLHRVASFRPLVSATSANRPSAVELANMGFMYNQMTSGLECEDCGIQVPLVNIESSSSIWAYHKEGCQFADKSLLKEDREEDKHIFEKSACSQGENTFEELACSQGENTFEELAGSQGENTFEELAGSEGRKRDDSTASQENCVLEATIAKGETIRCFDQVMFNQATSSEQKIGFPHRSSFEDQNQIYRLPEEGAVAGLASQDQAAAAEHISPDQRSEHHPKPRGECRHEEAAAAQQSQEDTLASTASVARSGPLGAEAQQQANVSRESGEEVGAVGGSLQPASVGATATANAPVSFDDFEDEHDDRSRNQPELQEAASTCSKNPGHYSYFPIHKMKLDYLPSSIRHPLVIQYFTVYAKLVVRILVRSKTNPRRSETSTELAKYGTGLAFATKSAVDDHENNSDISKWSFIKKYIPSARSKEFMYIKTSPYLINDNNEAQHTEVAFFYDHPSKRGMVVAKGVSIHQYTDEMGDKVSVLKCRTSDLSLVEMVRKSELELDMLLQQISQPLKEKLMQRVFVISHPHGNEKMLSYGEYVMVKCEKKSETINGQARDTLVKINNNTPLPQNTKNVRKMLLYTADTCKGSSGGVVITFQKRSTPEGQEHITADVWIHRGVNKKHQLNASALREITQDDVANHGKPLPPRPSFQDDDTNSSSNKVVTCPVFTVMASPAHPAYADYRKRLSSYPEPFYHVHTKEALSDAGLFYAGYGDCVRCFHCGLGLKSWRPGDSIYEEHHKNRPDCQFLRLKVKALGIDPFSFQTPSALKNTTKNDTDILMKHSPSQGDKAKSFTPCDVTSVESAESWEKSVNQFQTFAQVTAPETTVGMVLLSPPPSEDVVTKNSVEQVLVREQFYLKQLLTCKVCCRNPVKDLFLPCGELVACLDCSKLLTHCPSCNGKILATVTTYFS